ncbi:MAG: hypothetical protein EA370_11025 [Wenzhouxiangella sp.]|nr:MAG: hypothetical protein EA370_11025 [Wenzhouxiangella sp.]
MGASPQRAGWLPALFLLAALWVAWSEFVALRMDTDAEPFERLERLATIQPWGGLAAREAARQLEHRWRIAPELAEQGLQWQLARYPLDPWRWLLMARIQRSLELAAAGPDGAPERVARTSIDLATARSVQPMSREMQWQAVNLAQVFADADLIAHQLRLWLDGQPHMTDRALFLAARWIEDPGQRLDQVLPEGEDYLVRAMRFARSSRQPALAAAVWARLPQPRPAEDPALADYVHISLAHDDPAVTIALWTDLDPAYAPGRLPGGHFGLSLATLDALGWDFRMPRGAAVGLDQATPDGQDPNRVPLPASTPPAGSLRLDFAGTENINLVRPRVRFPVPEPGRYRISGWWRADALTTRSLPALVLRVEDGGPQRRIELPGQDFSWAPFAAEVEVEQADAMVLVHLHRRRTNAFDRDIAGALWLADLRFEPIREAPQ